ncbi:type II toxin-antitoxin system VapC family toxin [Microbacterium sp.]|uniref:type II toxin-antitoxin system VapC family toxin n=1 Tax=Microbacterium sp. TaxID=51671 RepID=UPI0039E5D5F3
MIVLDTNVVSEARRRRPDGRVTAWLAEVMESEVYLTATVVAEVASAISVLPPGRRRIELQDALDLLLEHEFAGRVLPFDLAGAFAFAHVIELRRRQGRPIDVADAQIASVCLAHDAALATRNVGDFAGLGLRVIDPWRG